MGRRKKQVNDGPLELENLAGRGAGAAGAARSVGSGPSLSLSVSDLDVVEYQPLTTEGKWRVGAWKWFQAEFPNVGVEQLPYFHAEVMKQSRSWMIARRLFGIQPVLINLEEDPDDTRIWGREELGAKLGLGREELNAELEHIRSLITLSGAGNIAPLDAVSGPKHFENKSKQNLLIGETDDEILRRYGYQDRLFDIRVQRHDMETPQPRSQADTQVEKHWFAGRVKQFRKVLESPVVSRVADQVLRCELRLRRAEDELMLQVVGTEEYRRMQRDVEGIQKSYRELLVQMDELAPWFNSTEKEINARDTFSEIIRGIQEYESRGETKLLDGIFTAYELQVLVRTSVQKPMPDYRLGWVTWVNQSRNWLWDPIHESQFRPGDFRKLDLGFQEGVRKFVEESGEHVPDLAREEDEYEPIYAPGEIPE